MHLLFRRVLITGSVLALAVFLREIWLIAFFAVVLATLWSFPIALLSRLVPRGIATLLTLAIFLGAAGVLTPLVVGPLVEQARQAEQKIPAALGKAKAWLKRQHGPEGTTMRPEQAIAAGMEKKTERLTDSVVDGLASALLKATSLGSTLAILFVLSLFFVFEPETYRKFAKALVPRRYEREYDELWLRLGARLRKWLGGILISMTIMGCLTALGLKLAGVENWFLLGVLTFSGTFVPYVGALASAVPGLLVALSQSNEEFFLAAGVYLMVHVVEGYIVDPLVMRRAVTIQPAILLLWQLTMGLLLGIFGFVVATPLYVCLKTAVDYLYVERGLAKAPYPPLEETAPPKKTA
ncbi:MAG: AI-2E family transporter [Bdellovibrionota bacterium]